MKTLILGNPKTESTKKLIREAKGRVHDVTAIHPHHFSVGVSSREGHDTIYIYDENTDKNIRIYKNDYHAVINRISGQNVETGLAITKHFENWNVFVVNSAESIKSCSDKFLTHQILSHARLPNPKSMLCSRGVEFKFIKAQIGLPFIAKKIRGSSQGKGVFMVRTPEKFDALMSVHKKMLIQEYIEPEQKSSATDIRAFVVGNDKVGRKVVASYMRVANDGDWRANYSISKKGKKVKLTDFEEKIAIGASQALGTGVCGVDIMRTKGNKSIIIEANSNPSLVGISKITRVDVANHILKFCERATNQERILFRWRTVA